MKEKMRTLIQINIILIFTLIIVAFPVSVFGARTDKIWDDAELIPDYEIDKLEQEIEKAEEETGWNILLITTNDTNGRSSEAYADDCYDEKYGINTDGIAFLIDMQNRRVQISTSGDALKTLSDDNIDKIIDEGYEDLKDGYYEDCFAEMIEKADWYKRTGGHEISTVEKVIAGIVAAVAFLICFGVVHVTYSAGGQKYRYDYGQNGKLKLRRQQDDFMHESVNRVKIAKESSSGSHSSHISSSGGTHGGGGRGF